MDILFLLLLSATHSCSARTDWLVDSVTIPATLRKLALRDPVEHDPNVFSPVELSNGLLSRRFSTVPNWATIDYRTLLEGPPPGLSMLRAVKPEARFSVDCGGGVVQYDVGGLMNPSEMASTPFLNRSAFFRDAVTNATAFQYVGHTTERPTAPFKWTPGQRHSPVNASWPPRGLVVVATFKAPAGVPAEILAANLTVEVQYMAYEGIPLMSKWVTVSEGATSTAVSSCRLHAMDSEILALNHPWSPVPASTYVIPVVPNVVPGTGKLHVELSLEYGSTASWQDEVTLAQGPQ